MAKRVYPKSWRNEKRDALKVAAQQAYIFLVENHLKAQIKGQKLGVIK